MKKLIPWLVVIVLVAAAGVGYWRYRVAHAAPAVTYKTAPVDRRTIEGRVTASGTLSALVTVQVGTQVSGRIQKLNADFNSKVKAGELVAKIDPQLFEAAVQSATANWLSAKAAVVSAEATALNADRQYARIKALLDQNLETQADLDTSQAAAAVAHAQIESQKANMAQVNLNYTNIISPIDGVVISRNVDVGQTVAASLSAPTIFTIAQDLTKMQVDTNVSEGDVGRLQVGMHTYFTVDSFPGQKFFGKIRQVRNSATTVQNVVMYDAVIDVDNTDLRLRPGMTANVTITYMSRKDVVAVSNAALRFRPPPALAGSSGSAASSSRGAGASSGAGGRPGGHGGHGRPSASGSSSSDDAPKPPPVAPATSGSGDQAPGPAPEVEAVETKTVWVLRDATPAQVTIHAGLSDGVVTEVIDGDLKEGDLVVVDSTGGDDGPAPAAPTGGASPTRGFRMF